MQSKVPFACTDKIQEEAIFWQFGTKPSSYGFSSFLIELCNMYLHFRVYICFVVCLVEIFSYCFFSRLFPRHDKTVCLKSIQFMYFCMPLLYANLVLYNFFLSLYCLVEILPFFNVFPLRIKKICCLVWNLCTFDAFACMCFMHICLAGGGGGAVGSLTLDEEFSSSPRQPSFTSFSSI